MTQSRYYSSTAQQTTLTGSVLSGTLVITVAATTGFPSNFPYCLALDYGNASEELVDVTSAAGLSLTVTRAVDGTSAVSHSNGATVKHVASGRDFNDSRVHEAASTNIHGLSGGAAVVGDTQTQTLTNKTYVNPIFSGTATGSVTGLGITNPVFSGTASGSLTNLALTTPTITDETVTNDVTTSVPLTVNAVTSTSVDLQDWKVNGSTLAHVDKSGNFFGANFAGGAWTSFTPTWTTTTGLHSPSIGNGSITMRYAQFGKLVMFNFSMILGTTTNTGSGATTSDNWQFTLPVAPAALANVPIGNALANVPNGHRYILDPLISGGQLVFGTYAISDTSDVPSNLGGIDALTPVTWGNGSTYSIYATGFYEAA